MKAKYFLLFLFVDFLIVLFLIPGCISSSKKDKNNQGNQSTNIVNNNQNVNQTPLINNQNTVEACYQFTTNQLNTLVTSIPNMVMNTSNIKSYNLYWGLGQNKDEANNKFQELKSQGLFDKNIQLIYISQQHSLLVAKLNSDKEALKQVREMSEKTKSIGGKWFYSSINTPLYNIKFNTSNNSLINQLNQQYSLKNCN